MVEGKLAVEGNIVIVVEGGVVNTVFYNGEQQTATIIDYDVEKSDNVKVIDGDDAEILSIETEHMSEELAKQLGFEHLTGGKASVLASHKGYDIVQYFANAINEGEEHLLYGDIYSSRSQVLLNHPGAALLVGYGVVDPFTGFHLDDAPDWFETIADVVYYIDELEQRKFCNKCNCEVTKSGLEEYSYQCLECDEDLYAFEVHQKKAK